MFLVETNAIAIKALLANKTRSFLTVLGVIIGVCSVILLVSLGKGAQNYITDQFEALGSNLIFVSPGKSGFGRDPAESFGNNKLHEKHVTSIENNLSEDLLYITPDIRIAKNVTYKSKSYFSSVQAFTEQGFDVYNFKIESGRVFNKSENSTAQRVAVIGKTVKNELFSNTNPIGEFLIIENKKFEIIGMFEPKGASFDEVVVIPFETAKKTLNVKTLSNITMKTSNNDIKTFMKKVERLLRKDLDEEDFTVMSQEDVLSTIQNVLQVLTLGLGAIAAISLLVGGIGIMNIMLVSVTERTREIGLRKALGATSNTVAMQFLIEATILSLIGGSIGILLGWLGSIAAQQFIRAEVPLWSVGLAFGFSAIVGIVFGTYPAIKASKKDPIEALRYE